MTALYYTHYNKQSKVFTMKKEIRESGYYFVKAHGVWEIAHFYNGDGYGSNSKKRTKVGWRRPLIECSIWTDDLFDEIDERRITREPSII